MTGAVNKEHPLQGINDLKNAGFTAAVLDYEAFAGVEHVIDRKARPDLMRQYYEKTVTVSLLSSTFHSVLFLISIRSLCINLPYL